MRKVIKTATEETWYDDDGNIIKTSHSETTTTEVIKSEVIKSEVIKPEVIKPEIDLNNSCYKRELPTPKKVIKTPIKESLNNSEEVIKREVSEVINLQQINKESLNNSDAAPSAKSSSPLNLFAFKKKHLDSTPTLVTEPVPHAEPEVIKSSGEEVGVIVYEEFDLNNL